MVAIGFFSIIVANLLRRKGRTVLVCGAVAAAVSVVVALTALGGSMRRKAADDLAGYGPAYVVLPQSDVVRLNYGGLVFDTPAYEPERLDEAVAAPLDDLEDGGTIEAYSPVVLAPAEVGGVEALVVGVDFDRHFRVHRWLEWRGRRPDGSNDVVLGFEAAAKLRKSIGEELSVGGSKMRIAAVLSETGSEEDSVIFAPLAVARNLAGSRGYDLVEITSLPGADIRTVERALEAASVNARVERVEKVAAGQDTVQAAIGSFAFAVGLIVVLAGASLVFLAVSSSVRERTTEIGVLRAVGFSESHVFRLFLGEAVVFGLAGGTIGVAAGLLVAGFVSRAYVEGGSDLGLVVAGPGLVLALLVALAGSYLPARRAARLDPAEAFRRL